MLEIKEFRQNVEKVKCNTGALSLKFCLIFIAGELRNRPFSYSRKEPGSSDILIQYYSRGSMSGVLASIAIVYVRKFYKL